MQQAFIKRAIPALLFFIFLLASSTYGQIVRIKSTTNKLEASGVLLTSGQVVTNYHVAAQAGKMKANGSRVQIVRMATNEDDEGSQIMQSSLGFEIKGNAARDLALLSPEKPIRQSGVELATELPELGALVTIKGIHTSSIAILSGIETDGELLLSGSAIEGDSGGGVFDAEGKLIGIIRARHSEGGVYAVSLFEIQKLIAEPRKLIAKQSGNDWERLDELKAKYLRLSDSLLPAVECDARYDREAKGFFIRHHDSHVGYSVTWHPFDKWELVCFPASSPHPAQPNGPYAWNHKVWLGIIYKLLFTQKPAHFTCEGDQCRFAVSDTRNSVLNLHQHNSFSAEQVTSRSISGKFTMTDGWISEFSMVSSEEDMTKAKVVDSEKMEITFAMVNLRDQSLPLPKQTIIEMKTGHRRFRNIMSFSNYHAK